MGILQNGARRRPGATVAQVTFSEGGGFGAVSSAERRGIPVFAPRGIAYVPCESDNLLMVEADGADVCAGVLSAADGLGGGELKLSSAGGAYVKLCNNGDIELNGVVITKTGEIRTP